MLVFLSLAAKRVGFERIKDQVCWSNPDPVFFSVGADLGDSGGNIWACYFRAGLYPVFFCKGADLWDLIRFLQGLYLGLFF